MTIATARQVLEQTRGWPDGAEMKEVEQVLRLLAKWRSSVLAKTYLSHHGSVVREGLFAGMTYLDRATEGSHIARLLGTYEAELHPHLARIVEGGLDCVLDIGCAEGYYAVGLAYRYPGLQVHAHDTSEGARAACAELAAKNDVAERVHIGGEFRPGDFQAFAGRRVLVLVDAEGAEIEILDPQASPALATMSIVVETHDVWRRGCLQTMRDRFEKSHDILELRTEPKAFVPPQWLGQLSELDILLAQWEWRLRLTPWLVMRPRASDHQRGGEIAG